MLQVFDDGSQTRDFTFVSDIVNGHILAVDAPSGEVFNLGGGARCRLTYRELLDRYFTAHGLGPASALTAATATALPPRRPVPTASPPSGRCGSSGPAATFREASSCRRRSVLGRLPCSRLTGHNV